MTEKTRKWYLELCSRYDPSKVQDSTNAVLLAMRDSGELARLTRDRALPPDTELHTIIEGNDAFIRSNDSLSIYIDRTTCTGYFAGWVQARVISRIDDYSDELLLKVISELKNS